MRQAKKIESLSGVRQVARERETDHVKIPRSKTYCVICSGWSIGLEWIPFSSTRSKLYLAISRLLGSLSPYPRIERWIGRL